MSDRAMISSQPITLAPRPGNERGFALVTGLVLLAVMSILGVTMMKVTRLETMMAGGLREEHIAFQAAEAAVRAAEATIEGTTSIAAFYEGKVGMLGKDDDEPEFFDRNAGDYAWKDGTDPHSIQYATGASCPSTDHSSPCYPEVYKQPRYIIKHVTDVTDSSGAKTAISISGYPGPFPPPKTSIFRVTAWGTSRDGSAESILQTYFGKIY